ncbi:hypothetical protein MTR_2g009733 [Medicago truncatula]|uniref:Uncharacterized protein n=1 Tax=Medicago truncatula TaxID=3880 RepID=A0A072VE72_MEDTR|nr:hypothetical protein MTR_2g009733 [Medicago truncatula]
MTQQHGQQNTNNTKTNQTSGMVQAPTTLPSQNGKQQQKAIRKKQTERVRSPNQGWREQSHNSGEHQITDEPRNSGESDTQAR